MKRPEYVAVVTKAYRAAIDGRRVTENDMQQLEAVFSRQGFTQGYYEGKTGQSMFGTRQEPEDNRELFPLPARRMNRAKARACRSSSTRWCVQESRRNLPRRTRTGMSARRSAPFPSRRWCIL